MPLLAPIALTAITASLLGLPIAPAVFELRRRRDAAPLPVSRHNGRISNFAESFHSRVEPLLAQLVECRLRNKLSRVEIEGLDALLVGRHDFNFEPAIIQSVAVVMFAAPVIVPSAMIVIADIYAEETLDLSEGAALRAAFALGNITLGENSSVLRWLHSQTGICLGRGSAVHGRLSAGQWIALSAGCSFQRMNAPQILTLDTQELDASTPGLSNRDLSHASGHVDWIKTNKADANKQDQNKKGGVDSEDATASSIPRRRIQGGFVLHPGESFKGNIIATGAVRISNGSCLSGSVKSYKDIVIEEGASVRGTVVSERSVCLGPASFVAGPIMAETGVVIGGGSRVGELDSPTTVSSTRIQIARRCRIHGTIWARERGSIEG
jgi:cytoskeletal protein CcmA (bactofilin family)